MRTVLTQGGIPTFVSTNEFDFISGLSEQDISSKQLTERERYIADNLVSRGVLKRINGKYGINRNQFNIGR